MTTIAYKDGIIAADGRILDSNQGIVTDRGQKIFIRDGIVFSFAGAVPDWHKFMDSWHDPEKGKNLDMNAFVWDGRVMWYCGSTDAGIWKDQVNEPRAIGSGADHAITAMGLGLCAKNAVKMAAKRDSRTGGRILTFNTRK